MKKLKEPSTFAFGLLFGTLAGLLVWYWYKSTSAEEGALDLLDRMVAADAKLRDLEFKQRVDAVENYITLEPNGENLPPFLDTNKAISIPEKNTPDDLQQVKGIGPVFAQRLQDVGVESLSALTAVSPMNLAHILGISEGRASAILAEAKRM